MKNAEKLKKDIHSKLNKWNERSMFSLKGVKNLSRSDIDTLVMYADAYIRTNGTSFNRMEPRGSIKDVLDAYGITVKSFYSF